MFNILILDDESLVCNSLKRLIANEERKVFIAHNSNDATSVLKSEKIDLLLLDYKLGEENGMQFLYKIREEKPDLIIIMVTAHGNIDIAVEAMRAGAFDFIQKDQEPAFIRYTVQRALENLRLKKDVEDLKKQFIEHKQLPRIISNSAHMKKILELTSAYANSDSTIFIGGETGTGKSLLAQYIHYQSNRFNQPFIPLNCSAIPGELIESELFGYKKGAFTGAMPNGKVGLVEQANSGTLFLDEIGDLQPELQSKLLHVIENKEFIPVGGISPTKVNIRIIAASNTDLKQKVDEKKFRLDLYYRLNVATIDLPPLRERQEDILPLVKYFINDFNQKYNKAVTGIEKSTEDFLLNRDWQGNVRELKNNIERAMILKKDKTLRIKDFINPVKKIADDSCDGKFTITLEPGKGKNVLHQAQQKIIKQALELTGNNVSQSAQLLGLPRTTLNHYIKKFNLHF